MLHAVYSFLQAGPYAFNENTTFSHPSSCIGVNGAAINFFSKGTVGIFLAKL